MTKGRKLRIQLTTEMVQEGQKETHEFDVIGEGFTKHNGLYLLYKETYDLPEGERVSVPVMMKVTTTGQVDLTRTTTARSKLTFDLDRETITHYQTPYGAMEIVVETKEIHHRAVANRLAGQLKVSYQLKSDQGVLGDYRFDLSYQEITD